MLVKHLTKFCIMEYVPISFIYVYCIRGIITHNALSHGKNIVGESFLVKCGVRREGEFYPHTLFIMYADELLAQLRQCGYIVYTLVSCLSVVQFMLMTLHLHYFLLHVMVYRD